jgi:hypothetical protein
MRVRRWSAALIVVLIGASGCSNGDAPQSAPATSVVTSTPVIAAPGVDLPTCANAATTTIEWWPDGLALPAGAHFVAEVESQAHVSGHHAVILDVPMTMNDSVTFVSTSWKGGVWAGGLVDQEGEREADLLFRRLGAYMSLRMRGCGTHVSVLAQTGPL